MLVALVVSVPPDIISLPFRNRQGIAAAVARYADRAWWPDYPRFLSDVRQRTRDGDSIALLVPARHWDSGYSYAYYRASYFLAGREVLPLVQPDDRLVLQNVGRAHYVAVWRMPPVGRGTIVWHGHGGLLVRQK
jgi:hypothetical protein